MNPVVKWNGGKRKYLPLIEIPENVSRYCEPFVGGGALFFTLPLELSRNINDIDTNLITLYITLSDKESNKELCDRILHDKDFTSTEKAGPGKKRRNILLERLREPARLDVERAFQMYLRCALSFRGATYSSGYDFRTTLNRRRIAESFRDAWLHLRNVKITCGTYDRVLPDYADDKDAFIFLDPPYFVTNDKRCYGHQNFEKIDHVMLAEALKKCKARFTLTYDNNPFSRSLYSWAKIEEVKIKYSMRTGKKNAKSRDIIVRNW